MNTLSLKKWPKKLYGLAAFLLTSIALAAEVPRFGKVTSEFPMFGK